MNEQVKGHIAALGTMSVWGTTFIATKVLLESFNPVEILIIRFVIAFVILTILSPRILRVKEKHHQWYFVGAGLTGICLYYLIENIALTFTLASNVGVVLAVAPFFSALAAYIFMRESEKITLGFFLGFAVAITGIALISFNGTRLHLSPKGDILAVLAAVLWAIYTLMTRKIAEAGYGTVPATKKIFFYGILFILPTMFIFDFSPDLSLIFVGKNLFNMLFLGIGASAICFITWNYGVKCLGIVKTSVYIYVGPVITVAAAALILHEPLTPMLIGGTILTLVGVIISEKVKIKEIN